MQSIDQSSQWLEETEREQSQSNQERTICLALVAANAADQVLNEGCSALEN